MLLNHFKSIFRRFSTHRLFLRVECFQNFEIFMKMWPAHPNTTTNKKIICSKSYCSVSEVSGNMSAISRYFYEGLGVNSDSEIVFLVKKCPELRYTDKYLPPWLVKRPIYCIVLMPPTIYADWKRSLLYLNRDSW